MINPDTLNDLLQAIADWRDELQTKLDDTRHTVSPKLFKLLTAEVATYTRVCSALVESIPPQQEERRP